MEPGEGLLTFRAEGNNRPDSPYYSRKIHWPGIASRCNTWGSGVTIGRGYDMKHRGAEEVIHHLTLAGIPLAKAKKIAESARKSFCAASDFVKENKDSIEEISEAQQVRLFEITYSTYVKDSIRFYNRYKKHDSVAWEKLHPALREVLIDMKYQGTLAISMVPLFGKNKKEDVIKLIKQTSELREHEPVRRRIAWLQEYMK
ncbi:hypothetical protein LU631_04160 [Erwinia tracheiphila]|uniref:Pesticin C-terminal domain-containing protein n=1 Tax=Erwinia tracheiphila TaxID=65700 RepID=A0A0M2KJL0_9GAMM|nr:hypothetical protein [Erwinia tracheiphila]EOS95448.1 hypothetical protein ETR_08131 [Erwinia tracheiphila PSU-1]KKF37201.1 hypothetical protein SY86_20185 [Erwinia tracheiphila]UIA88591.1 hypothetical protein LU631_04160 [Erwinia tracheiphila]UIA96971.1 hypothetical protein LU633_02835 [Erwinia tracheiphila]